MLNDYIYKSPQSNNINKAIIILPEIYGLTDFICDTADRFASELEISSYALDFFYQLNHTPNKLDYDADAPKGIELMQKMKGIDFVEIFNSTVDIITKDMPELKSLAVCGFCFGGRLAYLAGANKKVSKVISFYGAGANTPSYINDKSPIENLCSIRADDPYLSILSFYGSNDESITTYDREQTAQAIKNAGINYEEIVYDGAGHAFFNNQRPNMYNESASVQAWQRVKEFLS